MTGTTVSKIIAAPQPIREVTLVNLMTELQAQRDLLNTLLKMQNVMSDQIDDLITKVDEINLPTGPGFTTEYES